jgi:signal transduction histidine kinase
MPEDLKTIYIKQQCKVCFHVLCVVAGILATVMNNIFNPYYSTKPRGTGSGLPIAHRIIKAHKGKIEIRNKDGCGAVFAIELACLGHKCT